MPKILAIISDTAIYHKDGFFYGFNSVVNEIKSFEHLFDKIIWIGFDFPEKESDPSLVKIESNKVEVILLNQVGGKSISSISKILVNYPIFFFKILKYIKNVNVIHSRAPSHPAFIAILISFFIKNKIWWHKFAGSWNTETIPFFYKIQRNLLISAKHSKVTINGFWPNQPKHCLSFENPCLTDEDIDLGKEIIKSKRFNNKFTLCFVGRLDESKGVDVILESLKKIDIEKIEKIHFIGDSKKRSYYENEASFLGNKSIFHGFLSKEKVYKILADSHFLLLPSKSEGFPKVIAEAACFGTISIVSNVGSISHYINDSNGFLWEKNEIELFYELMNVAFNKESFELDNLQKELLLLAEKFTFTNYVKKIKTEILK